MNPNNYCTLEAAKRLVEAGIVLETEAVFVVSGDLSYIAYKDRIITPCITIPAPTMAEIWRELPKDDNKLAALVVMYFKHTGHFEYFKAMSSIIRFLRTVDILIDLLIWVKKEAKS